MAGARIRRAVAAAALAVVACTACTPDPPAPAGPPPVQPGRPEAPDAAEGADRAGGSLRIAVPEPSHITPADATGPGAALVLGAVFEPLTRLDADGAVEPALAARWSHDASRTTWRFELREGATFHDGTPVRASDVIAGWTLAAVEGANGFHLRNVVGYDAIEHDDATTLRGLSAPSEDVVLVELETPDGEWPSRVSHPALSPIPAHLLADAEAVAAWELQPIGNGPFAVAEPWSSGGFLRLAAAEDGAGNRPVLDEVLIRFGDPNDAFIAFQQGRTDVVGVPDGALAAARSSAGTSPDGRSGPGVIDAPVPSLYFLAFDRRRPPFDDPDVRRAVALAIDRDALAEGQRDGVLAPANGIIPPPLLGARSEPCDSCVRNVAVARRLFAQASISRIELWISTDAGHEAVAQQLGEQLAEVGVELVVRSRDFQGFLDAIDRGSATMFRFGWTAEHLTPTDVLEPLFATDRIGESNVARWSDLQTDRLLTSLRGTAVAGAQEIFADMIERRILDDDVIVPLFTYRQATAVGPRVTGWVQDPLGRVDLTGVGLDGS